MRRRTVRRIRLAVGSPEYWVGLAIWLVVGLFVGLTVQNVLERLAP